MTSSEPADRPDPFGGTERGILEAASAIIATEDFDALSMRRVAAQAKVSLSTVVRHSGTTDALRAALVGQGGEEGVLGAEVADHGRERHAGASRDAPHREGVELLGGDDLARGFEDLSLGLVGGGGGHGHTVSA